MKLADFGLSRTADLSQPKTICGTENYLAPEIIQAARLNERYSEKVRSESWLIVFNSRTAIAGAIIDLLLVFLRLEEEYWFS